MAVQLWIGEVAKLLGVTTKTIRYYEDIGLLDEPVRTESGYRVYNAQDLLRLYRIKHLQDLGLSLDRIQVLLQDAEQDPQNPDSAHEILRALESELTSQIAELEARRTQIQALLAQVPVDPLKHIQELPPTLRLMQEYLGEGVGLDAPAATYAGQLWSQLDIFLWNHTEYQQQQRELIRYVAEEPEARAQIVDVMRRVAALNEETPSDAELERLADDVVLLQADNPILHKILSFDERATSGNPAANHPAANVDVLAQVLTAAVEPSPVQYRLFELVEQRLSADG